MRGGVGGGGGVGVGGQIDNLQKKLPSKGPALLGLKSSQFWRLAYSPWEFFSI